MRFDGLDLNLLVALNAVLRERNISRAAETVHLSQSAMSNALSRLREYFDDDLLVQVGRKFELTPRAEALHEAVHDILLRIKSSVADEPQFFPAESDRRFKLLVSEYTTSILIPRVLELAWEHSKNIGFDLVAQVTDPVHLIARGESDLLIAPESYMSPDHPSEVIYDETYVCVVWSENKNVGDSLTFEQYAQASHVGVEIGPDHLPTFVEGWLMQKFGLARKIDVTTPSLLAPISLVVGTERIATVHARAAKRALHMLPVKILPTPFEIPVLKMAMQWHKYRSNDPGIGWLRGLIKTAASHIDEAYAPQSLRDADQSTIDGDHLTRQEGSFV
jgi:DNA-binding transcriptional LysR family regulator